MVGEKKRAELEAEAAAIDAAQERSAMPHPRDLLEQEMLEEAKGRPRDVGLEKHGADIEAQILRDLERMHRTEVQRQPSAPEPERERRGPDFDMDS